MRNLIFITLLLVAHSAQAESLESYYPWAAKFNVEKRWTMIYGNDTAIAYTDRNTPITTNGKVAAGSFLMIFKDPQKEIPAYPKYQARERYVTVQCINYVMGTMRERTYEGPSTSSKMLGEISYNVAEDIRKLERDSLGGAVIKDICNHAK